MVPPGSVGISSSGDPALITGAQSTQPLGGPTHVGPYRIVRLLGEGGMGVVYLAEQDEPVRRQVALKILRRGLNTNEVVARFHCEQQTLAMMEHPNITRVYDAGVTEFGEPYFVMEYVSSDMRLPNTLRRTGSASASASTFSFRFAERYSTPTRRESSIATSSRRT